MHEMIYGRDVLKLAADQIINSKIEIIHKAFLNKVCFPCQHCAWKRVNMDLVHTINNRFTNIREFTHPLLIYKYPKKELQ